MKPYKVTYTKKEGKIFEEGYRSGRKNIELREPSQWYIDNILKPLQEEAVKDHEYEKRQIKIANKMKEMAEKELEKEDE